MMIWFYIGIILYIMLCGYPPFFGKTPPKIIHKIKKGKLKFEGNNNSISRLIMHICI